MKTKPTIPETDFTIPHLTGSKPLVEAKMVFFHDNARRRLTACPHSLRRVVKWTQAIRAAFSTRTTGFHRFIVLSQQVLLKPIVDKSKLSQPVTEAKLA